MKKSAATGTKIRTMLITVSTRSLVLSTLIIVLSVNTSSTFQYDWWNNLTNASSQEASSQDRPGARLPAAKTVRERLWSTAWTPMISVTAEAAHNQSTTPAPPDLPAEAAAVTSFHPPALLSLSGSASPPPPLAQSTTAKRKSESLEWQPSIVTDHKDERNHADGDDFNAFAARNTRTYVPLAKIRSKSGDVVSRNSDPLIDANILSKSASLKTQKISWDDHVEFPSSTLQPQKLVSLSEPKATTTSIWADQGTSPGDSITSSTNSKKWSSRTGSQRISNRFGTIRQRKQQEAVKPTTLDEIKQSQNLERTYEDAVADIQSSSEQASSSSPENEGNDDASGESERISFAGKTNSNKERLAVKGRQQSPERKTPARQQKRQKVALQIKISPVEQDVPQEWSNAKVSQYFRWENPATSTERLVDDEENQSDQELRKQIPTSSLRTIRVQDHFGTTDASAGPTQRSTARTGVNRSGAIKGTTNSFARQRLPTTTTTFAPDYETEDVLTERSVPTRQPRLEASYEKASRQAVKQQKSTAKKTNRARLSSSAKAQSVVQSNGRGYEWSTDIDHNDERPAEIKSTTLVGGDDRPPASSTRYTNPTTTSIAATTTITTARPTASRLQTKTKQTGQRQASLSILKSSFEHEDSVSSIDPDDDESLFDDQKGKFQKKSGVQYTGTSVEREDDVTVERGLSKKSGEQGSGNPDDPENCRLEDSIPGTPLTDYPTYAEIPKTNFKCSDQTLPGYYGDVEAQCQVFHVCQHDGRKNDFLCPIGTIFNQEIFVCDWWQNFRCQDTPNFYRNNDELYRTPVRIPEVANNQLRKRTDAIEREEEEPPYSDEVRDDRGSVVDDSIDSAEVDAEVSPAPIPRVSVAAAVKGYKEKQVVTEEPAGVKSGRIASYGARMSRKRQRGEKLAAAASKSKTTISPSGNLTEAVRNVTVKMSTSAMPLPVN